MQEWINTTAGARAAWMCILSMQEETEAKAKGPVGGRVSRVKTR